MAQEDSVRSTLGLKVLVVEDELVLAMELGNHPIAAALRVEVEGCLLVRCKHYGLHRCKGQCDEPG